jgi:hypothetical protein
MSAERNRSADRSRHKDERDETGGDRTEPVVSTLWRRGELRGLQLHETPHRTGQTVVVGLKVGRHSGSSSES